MDLKYIYIVQVSFSAILNI